MAEGVPLKVALLARAGEARGQLRRALDEFGAELVLEADPNELDAGQLAGSGATTVLVSVEPAVESALERLEAVLLAPGLTVLYDEAETTARLQGWDLNRWARHLAAKLLGKDVLPPGAEPAPHAEAAEHLVAAPLPTPSALAAGARIEDYTAELGQMAAAVPSAELPSDLPQPEPRPGGEGEPPAWAAPPAAEGDPGALALDDAALAQALGATDAPPPEREPASAAEPQLLSDEAIDLSGLELIDDPAGAVPPPPSVSLLSAKEIRFDASVIEVEELTLSEEELAAFGELGAPLAAEAAGTVTEGEEALELDEDLAKLAASLDENLEALSVEPVAEEPLAAPQEERPPPPDVSHLRLDDGAAPLETPAATRPRFDFSGLSLELAPVDESPAAPLPATAPAAPPPALDIGHLSLAPLADAGGEAAAAVRTVLVLSGIGGPDAVRQLVRALPASFPGAVLLKQNLDGGRHDRFVEQLAKISRLPVALSEPHETPPGNAVRVLPDGASAAGALSFPKEGGVAALIEAVAALDGAIVVLSGADEAAIEPLKAAMAGGVRVLVQDPSSCFDGKVAGVLREAGAPAVPAADLAARLDAYFSS
ncbi:chemotaxis protein CheB [Silanimonas lenta]|uniref:chemotaxis protein CheB n=1 Tax=Silanimonas lenta TaxID=265429 RepID=UPI0012EC27AF|nr:chemotaxis protein CheB [Silanimonas lenta]